MWAENQLQKLENEEERKTSLQLSNTFPSAVYSQTKSIFLPALKNTVSNLDDKTELCFLIGVHDICIQRGQESHIAGLCPRKSIEFNTHIIPQAYVSRTNAKIHVHYLI